MNVQSRGSTASRGMMGGRGMMGRGGPGMMGTGERARDFKGTISKLIQYVGRYKLAIVIVMFIAAASTIFSIVGPKILGQATTTLFNGVLAQIAGTGSVDFTAISNILLELVGLYFLSATLAYIQGWVMSGISMNITYRFRKDISEKINRLPLKYFDGTTHGEVLSRVTNDVDTINQTLNQSLTQIITSVVTIIGVLVMMFTISWLMSLVALAIVPISMLIISVIIRMSQKYFLQQQDYLGHVNGHVEEMFGGHVVVKAFNGEAKNVAQFDDLNNTLYDSAWKSQYLSSLMWPVMSFISNLGYVAVVILGGWMAIRNAITIGDIQAFIQYVNMFTQPITSIANISNIFQQTAAAAERVFEFLGEPEEVVETTEPVKLPAVEGCVEFDHVHFGYSPEKIIIKDFSATVQPGQKIAIVGPTGAGKTTMVKLLMRFYDVTSGAILVDGHNIQEFSRGDLRRMFAMVLQDTWLYNGTIMENIRYGRAEATDDEVIAASKAAYVDHFVRTLPEGYNLVLNEEASNVSQGQMQLLTIARAILADPKILILDEATSSVDTRTEILIQQAMDNLMNAKQRTSFIIAHRLSTIRDADLILVMNEGDIVEQGTHLELLKRGGFYAEMYNSQFAKMEENGNGYHLGTNGAKPVEVVSPVGVEQARQYMRQAFDALKQGQREEARRLAQEAIHCYPNLEDAYLILAAVSEPKEAIEHLKKALEINPHSQVAHESMERVLLELLKTRGLYTETDNSQMAHEAREQVLLELLKKGGFYAETDNRQFAKLEENGNEDGYHHLEKNGSKPVEAVSPVGVEQARQHTREAFKALQEGNKDEARRIALQTMLLYPKVEDSYLIMAALSEPREAIEYLKKALEINPRSQMARNGMEWAVQRLRKASELEAEKMH